MTKRAIILAAGKGERLVNGLPFPKPLKRVGGVPLVVRMLRNLERAGVQEAVVVVGHQGEVLVRGVSRCQFGLQVRFVHNDAYERGDGHSVLAAESFVTGPTLLVMGDHLFAPELLVPVVASLPSSDEIAVGVDFDAGRTFDPASALKVRVDGSGRVEVGHDLPDYDGLATGAMMITPAFIDTLRQGMGAGCSVAAGLGAFAERGRLRAVSVGSAMWIDVDTRAAYAFAERNLARYGDALQPTPMVAGL